MRAWFETKRNFTLIQEYMIPRAAGRYYSGMKKAKRRRNGRNGCAIARLAVHGAHDACIDAMYEAVTRTLKSDPKLRARFNRLAREALELLIRDLSD